MKKNTIVLVSIITTLSLAGIILTQIYWVNTAYKLREEQFESGVRIAAHSLINRLIENKNDSVFQVKLKKLSCRNNKINITDIISTHMLDSLLVDELKCMDIKSNYCFGVYSKYTNKFVLGNFENHKTDLINSKFQYPLTNIYKPGDYYLSIHFSNTVHILLYQMEMWVYMSILFLVILIISFIFVIASIFKQKKISEIKTNFINNMTHELKTPISTTMLAAEMIQRKDVLSDSEKIKRYASIIIDENSRLQSQVEQILQVAILESSNQQFKIQKVNLHELLTDVVNSFELIILEKNINFTLEKDAADAIVMGDKVHLLNLFYNIVDNAIKYTPNKPIIKVSTWNENGNILVSIKDNGIGISKEYQSNIFKNLYRVPTGNLHEVRGFGLGLYYVKTIVDQFNGSIELISELGKGSDFQIIFPNLN